METQVKAIIKKDSNKEYHSNKEFIGSTGLKKYLKSPLHAKPGIEKEPTEAMVFGSAYHTMVLQPELFFTEYFVLDSSLRPNTDKDFRDALNKKWKQELMLANSHKTFISIEDFNIMREMHSVLKSNKTAYYLLTNGEKEVSHYTDYMGCNIKIRPDNLNSKFISDLKTCVDASPEAFSAHCHNMGYDLSAALYTDVHAYINDCEPLPFNLIAQEKDYPYAVAIYNCSQAFIEFGRNRYMECIDRHKLAKEYGNYLGYEMYSDNEKGIINLELPKWAYNK